MNTPVLFLVFNRPDTTEQVFEEIRKAKPPRLYIAADGPRHHKAAEKTNCQQTREIATQVDWDCDVFTLFREKNLGCKEAVSSAITWFFEHEEQGIILEDDCLPSQSFFRFCEEMLERYKNEESIFIVSGYNKQNQWKNDERDYFFSNFGGIWGWASWRRAWKYYDPEMESLDELSGSGYFENTLGNKPGGLRKKELLNARQRNADGTMNSWAYPWAYSRHALQGLACVPAVSLIENIGFGSEATHTTVGSKKRTVVRREMKFPLVHNDELTPDLDYDSLYLKQSNILFKSFRKILRSVRRAFKND